MRASGLLLILTMQPLWAQSPLEDRLAAEVQSAAKSVEAQTALSVWKRSHSRERVELAATESQEFTEPLSARPYQLCADSVANAPSGATRVSVFYVPEVHAGALPELPSRPDRDLTGNCPLGGVWFEVDGANLVAAVVGRLSAVWQAPSDPGRSGFLQISLRLSIQGAGCGAM